MINTSLDLVPLMKSAKQCIANHSRSLKVLIHSVKLSSSCLLEMFLEKELVILVLRQSVSPFIIRRRPSLKKGQSYRIL